MPNSLPPTRVNTGNINVLWVAQNIGWNYDTIQTAIDVAQEEATVMVCPGTYVENIVISKPVHLMSSDPASVTVQETTIIDGNEGAHGVEIGSQVLASGRDISPSGTVTVEGFTITNAMSGAVSSGERNGLPEIAAGIKVHFMNACIRNNIITKN